VHGYGALTANDLVLVDIGTDLTIPLVETMSYNDFKSAYNGGRDITSNVLIERGPYGWPLSVKYNPSSSTSVTVEHIVTNGAEYKMNKDVNVKVKIVGTDIEMTYMINGGLDPVPSFDNTTDGSDTSIFIHPETGDKYTNVKLVKVFYKDKEYFITAIPEVLVPGDLTNPTAYLLKSTGERVGMYLYFEITRV